MQQITRSKEIKKITIIGAIVNLLLAILKIIIGTLSNSGALIADGFHSFSDLLSDAVVWYAAKHSSAAPDAEHPYGHERFETAATLGLGVILAIVGFGIIFDAIDRSFNPAPIVYTNLLFSAVILSILAKEGLYWYTLIIGKKINSEMLKANAWHHRSDALSSVVVLIGVIGSINGHPYLDGIAAIVVGIMVIYIALKLGINAIKELVDSSIGVKKITLLKSAITKVDGVKNIHLLRTRKNAHKISCDMHVQVDPFLSVSEGHVVAVNVELVAKKCLPDLKDVMVHIDSEKYKEHTAHKKLPARKEMLSILHQTLLNNKYSSNIQNIRLHYLKEKIHVDFYLSLECLESNNSDTISTSIKTTLAKINYLADIKIYFGAK